MNWNFAIPLLAFIVPYVASRQMLATAVTELPDDKKLELVNVSAKGRRYLWLWLLPIVLIAIFDLYLLWPAVILVLVAMLVMNERWVRSHDFPPTYVRKHFHATVVAVFAFIAPVVAFFVMRLIDA
jgi:hypothetical protein